MNHKMGVYRFNGEAVDDNVTGAIATSCEVLALELINPLLTVTEG